MGISQVRGKKCMLHGGSALWGDVYINTVTKKHSIGQLLEQQPLE